MIEPHAHSLSDSASRLEEAIAVLKNNSLRITQPRKAILTVMLENDGPTTIEEIHRGLTPELCDLATVYRGLAVFEKLGLVRRSHFHDGTSLYEMDMDPHHHHHIICRSCQKVEPLDVCMVEGLERLVRDRGYRDVSHMLEFFGICPICATESGGR